MPITSPDYLALLAAVCAAADDDAPRLVLADWLDEHGELERAAFIRVQVGDPALSAQVWGYRNGDWNAPADSVLPARALRSIPGTPRGWNDGTELVFCRGLLGSLICTAADWLAHGDALSWSPEQTVEAKCTANRNPRLDLDNSLWYEFHQYCDRCSGTGVIRVPRPCPPTAQPVTEVRLTTELAVQKDGLNRWSFIGDPHGWRSEPFDPTWTLGGEYAAIAAEVILQVCRLRWPAVTAWHLPPARELPNPADIWLRRERRVPAALR